MPRRASFLRPTLVYMGQQAPSLLSFSPHVLFSFERLGCSLSDDATTTTSVTFLVRGFPRKRC